jgi:hypothetical protein
MIATERAMSAEERAQLAGMLATSSRGPSRSQLAAVNAVAMWVLLMSAFAFVWALFAWLVRRFAELEFGLQAPAAPWVWAGAGAACAAFATGSSRRWFARRPDERAQLAGDLERGAVIAETFTLTAVKCFQEPEHGGLMYFFRTDDGGVLVFFDGESQDLGAGGGDPLQSSFRPRTKVTIARAPLTRLALGTVFQGPALEPGAVLDLAAPPREWPDSAELCPVPWDDLERHFGTEENANARQAK